MGRFINADAFTSTGQGLLGNNVFVYCLNTPVNRTDTCGAISIWNYLAVDSEWGFVHRMVQAHIYATYGNSVLIEIGVKGCGRADIVAPAIGAVWEVKHEGSNYTGRCAEALAQATKYLNGTCTDGTVIKTLGQAQAFSGTFCIYTTKANFEVNYSTPQDGVVLYTVKETKKAKEAYAYAYEYVPHAEREKNKTITAPVGLGALIFVPVTPGCGNMGDPRQAYQIY